MTTSENAILYWGEYCGFAGGIERSAFATAQALARHGWQVDYCGNRNAPAWQQFRQAFREVLAPAQALSAPPESYRLVVIHKLPPLEILQQLAQHFSGRLLFWAHDHDLYCPRRHYYTPIGRRNCQRQFQRLRCAICAMTARPANGNSPLGVFAEAFSQRPAVMKILQQEHAAVLSQFMAANLLRNGFDAKRIHTLPPFMAPESLRECEPSNTAPRTFLPEGKLRLLFIGQLIRGKGCDTLLEMVARLQQPCVAHIVGDGNDRPRLEALSRQLQLQDKVIFHGYTPHPEQFLHQADIAVYPFRWQEPFGLCGMEALAAGLPVVAYDVGGIREWLQDQTTGIAVPHDNLPALTAAVEELSRDPARLAKMSRAAQKFARENFTEERFILAFQRMLSQLCK